MKHSPRPSLESRLRDLLDLPSLPERSLVPREDTDQEPEEGNEENSPFERFIPTVKDSTIEKNNAQEPDIEDESFWKGKIDRKKLEQLKHKLRNYKFMISLPVASIIIACTIVVTCCCTVYLRNRLVGCINVFKPKKKVNKYLNVDPEVGTPVKKAKLLQKRLPSLVVPRARSLSQDYAHVAIQNSIQSVETPPTGCCTCCKKKKKKREKK